VNERQSFDRKRARSEFGSALNANTAFANLLQRKGTLEDVIHLTNTNFHVVKCGASHFTKWDADWLFYGGKSENFTIEDLSSAEDLFLRSDVSEDETMRVANIPLRPIIRNLKIVRTTTTVGLYQIGSGMFEWAADLASRLEEMRNRLGRPLTHLNALEEYQTSPEWVNDDTLLIARCLRDTSGRSGRTTPVLLVSGDKRLANQMSNTCNVQVIRVDPQSYISVCLGHKWDPMKELDPFVLASFLKPGTASSPVEFVYNDTGSIASQLVRVEEVTNDHLWIKTIITDPSQSINHMEKRSYKYLLSKADVLVGMKSMNHRPTYRDRKFRVPEPFGSESSQRRSLLASRSASSKDWRSRI
jgi:hypothetical protein